MWRRLFPRFGKPKKPDLTARVLDFHQDQALARPHFAGIQAMEDTLFFELDEALNLSDAEAAMADKNGNHLPLAEHVRETCFIAAYAMDTAARLERNPQALDDGGLHRALRGQCGTALARRYAKTSAIPGQPVDRDQMMQAAIKDIYKAEVVAQAMAARPSDYSPMYGLIGDRIGIKPVDRERHLRERVRELQTFARKIPTMFEQLKADTPNL
ncbi:hypothetical protein AAII07_31950 [Microvirga sp. 0TCS3.31]